MINLAKKQFIIQILNSDSQYQNCLLRLNVLSTIFMGRICIYEVVHVMKSYHVYSWRTREISREEQENPLGKQPTELMLLPRSVSLMY